MIYVNGRFLTQKMTGVQRFALEISKKLVLLSEDFIFLVPCMDDIKYKDDELLGFNIVELKGGGGHYWEQVTLPKFMRRERRLLVNLCNTAPVFYKKQIVTHHDIIYIRYPQSFSKKFLAFYKMLSPLVLNNSLSILTVSEFSKKEISEYYRINSDKITVIYNAVNDSFVVGDKVDKKDYVLAVSSPVYHKNFQGLIEAYIESDINTKLLIIGEAANSFAGDSAYKKDDRVEFIGRVDDPTLIKLYQNARLFIFPSFYEGFGIPPLEAQACGCPVISSNRASLPEVLSDSTIYFDPDSKEDIIDAINKVLKNTALAKDLSFKGLDNVKRFSWEKSAEKIYHMILQNSWSNKFK